MSWLDRATRPSRIAMALAVSLGLGGCLQPVYGNFAAGGPGIEEDLKRIAIEPIPERVGHYLGDDLVMALNGTGSHPTPLYHLYVTVSEGVQTPLIDTVSGTPTAATVVLTADYRLVRIDTQAVVTKGNFFVFKSYDRTSERFSNIRAARDAEIRDAKALSDELRIRLAAALSERRQP